VAHRLQVVLTVTRSSGQYDHRKVQLCATTCNSWSSSSLQQRLPILLWSWIVMKDSRKIVVDPSTVKRKNMVSRRNSLYQRGMLPLRYLYDLYVCVCRYLKLLQNICTCYH